MLSQVLEHLREGPKEISQTYRATKAKIDLDFVGETS